MHPAWERPRDVLVKVARSFALTRSRPRPFPWSSRTTCSTCCATSCISPPRSTPSHVFPFVCLIFRVMSSVSSSFKFVERLAISERVRTQRLSCLLPRRYHNRWRTSPASVSSTSRVGSRRMVFITRFPLICVGWMGVVNQGKLCGSTPIHPTRILLASPPQNKRVLTPDTPRMERTIVLTA